jgi:hypothetical protein
MSKPRVQETTTADRPSEPHQQVVGSRRPGRRLPTGTGLGQQHLIYHRRTLPDVHERHRLGRIGGVIYGSSITTLEEAGIAQITIGASVVRDASPFYRGRIVGGVLRAETDALFRNRQRG